MCPVTVGWNLQFYTSSAPITSTYAMALISGYPSTTQINKYTQISQPATTMCGADAITLHAVPAITMYFPPMNLFSNSTATPYDEFQGRHRQGAGNISFYDGHVEALQVYPRPASTYSSPPSASNLAIIAALHVGPAVPLPAPDYSSIGSNGAYVTLCQNSLNYYFYAVK